MSRQTKPVCVAHQCEMRVEKNDTRVLFNADFGPYQVQSGDMWACPIGNERIIVGWGDNALAQHFEPDFAAFLENIDVAVPACASKRQADYEYVMAAGKRDADARKRRRA